MKRSSRPSPLTSPTACVEMAGDVVVSLNACVLQSVIASFAGSGGAFIENGCRRHKEEFRRCLFPQAFDDGPQVVGVLIGRNLEPLVFLEPLGVVNTAIEVDDVGLNLNGPLG